MTLILRRVPAALVAKASGSAAGNELAQPESRPGCKTPLGFTSREGSRSKKTRRPISDWPRVRRQPAAATARLLRGALLASGAGDLIASLDQTCPRTSP